jgi:hypothetical protein
MGRDFMGDGVCRALYQQVITQTYLFGSNHDTGVAKDSNEVGTSLALHYYSKVRGIVISKSSRTANALYTRFDARGDCFGLGHDNADRGTFTLSSLGKTWIPELPWNTYPKSVHHSILHIDGFAQTLKAPCVKMLMTPTDDGVASVSAADLTAAYANQWFPAYPNPYSLKRYIDAGWAPVTQPPAAFGWESSDYDTEIGLPTTLYGERDWGFIGLYTLKKQYRPVSRVVRSTLHVRAQGNSTDKSYFCVVDKAAVGDGAIHAYQFHAVLASWVNIDESQSSSSVVALTDGAGKRMDVVIRATMGRTISYEIKSFAGEGDVNPSRSLVITSRAPEEEFWILFHPRSNTGSSSRLIAARKASGEMLVTLGGESRSFILNAAGALELGPYV